MGIAPKVRYRWNGLSIAGLRRPDLGALTVLESPFGRFSRSPDTSLPSLSTSPRISSAYAVTGLRRRSRVEEHYAAFLVCLHYLLQRRRGIRSTAGA